MENQEQEQAPLPGFERDHMDSEVKPQVPPADKAFVDKWKERIKLWKKKHEPAFKRMRKCMELVTRGADKGWDDEDKYVVPIIARHINLAVAQIYAKNPTTVVERKRRLMHQVWDGKAESVAQAMEILSPMPGPNGMSPPVDPVAAASAQALMADMQAVAEYNAMVEKVAETVHLLWQHHLDAQTINFKKQMKALVRRTKTTNAGYVRLGFQREYEPRHPDSTGLEDSTDQIALLRQTQQQIMEKPDDTDNPQITVARATEESLRFGRLIQEGLIFNFPKSTRVLIDPATDDLSTLSGCNGVVYISYLTPDEIERTYGVKVNEDISDTMGIIGWESDQSKEPKAIPVYEVWCKRMKSVFVICEFHEGFLQQPGPPPVFTEKFFDLYPLVFNDIESEEELFSPSDVWRARHMQAEYNRSREGLREHRIAARPYYVASQALDEQDGKRLSAHAAHEIITLKALGDGQDVKSVLQAGPTAPIDPNLYEVENIHQDLLRSVGSQEANLGALSGGTATESSIAESSRMSGLADNVDDLDDLLLALARDGARILMMEMSKEKVLEIVGPGAAWPETPQARTDLADEIFLKFEAGSSGRPNKAQDLANLERGASFITQMPGVNPNPLVRKFARLVDIEPEDLHSPGSPSIVALNSMAGKPPAAPQGNVPQAQGSVGGGGAQQPEPTGPQPAFPTQGENSLENLPAM